MRKYQVVEIFYSLQGEGFWTGTPAIFLRFAGCNLHCPWCDTDHTPRMSLTAHDIQFEVARYPARHVVLTGGEPGLQLTEELVETLHRQGKYLQVETNGTTILPDGIDWITLSPKEDAFWRTRTGNELKVVYTGESQDLDWFYKAADCDHHYLQPCSMQNIPETIEKVKACPQWTLSVQLHKLLQIA